MEGDNMRKTAVTLVALLCLVAVAVPAAADGGKSTQFPSEIDLPDGFFPEGIAVGQGSTFYVGSLADGSIYKGDLRTGEGAVFTEASGAFPFTTVGLDVDQHNRVWAAGSVAGTGRVYDGTTGELLATYVFTDPGLSFINDVIVTPEAAWFTDSGTDVCPPGLCFLGERRLFKVALEPGGGLPDDPYAAEEIQVNVPDVGFANLNGIETMPGRAELIVAHTTAGALYRVDPETGEVAVLYGPPNDDPLVRPDGITRLGRTLYVVENAANRIAVINIDPSTGTGTLQDVLTVTDAQTPSTAAVFGSAVYTVDARLGTPFVGPYKIFRIER
jgi:sugar lactone lactonase YvrE